MENRASRVTMPGMTPKHLDSLRFSVAPMMDWTGLEIS